MLQKRISIEETQDEFLNRCGEFGFKDRSSLVRAAIDQLKKRFETQRLVESAILYSELYEEDSEIKKLTEAAVDGWPSE
ncbi:MAG: hypothetical protein V3U24_00705 [Candidatus Neomarinimicrobiota bacterium]